MARSDSGVSGAITTGEPRTGRLPVCRWAMLSGLVALVLLGGCAQNSSQPDFDASPTDGIAPLVVTFTVGFSGGIRSTEWDFGDGTSSTETNPSHAYVDTGLYTVSLTLLSDTGVTYTVTKPGLIRVGAETSSYLFWNERGTGTISRGERDGTGREVLVSGLISPEDLAVAGSRIYWTDYGTGRVESANLDGTGRAVIASGLHSPTGVTVDPLGGKVYWTVLPSGPSDPESVDGAVQRANLDGSDLETLVSFSPDQAFAWQIAVDPVAGRLYWISLDWDAVDTGACNGRIVRAGLDGSGAAAIVSGICDPTDLTLDGSSTAQASHIYWTSEDPGTLSRAGVNGAAVTVLVSGIPEAESVAVDPNEGALYWTAGTVLQRADLDGGDISTVFTGLSLPEGMAVER
jgi:PKD repeat protein